MRDPDWQSDDGTVALYCGDCLEILPELPPVDAVITDPPYCSGGATEAGRGRATHQGLRSDGIKAGRFKWFKSDNMTTAGLCELLRSMCVRAPVVEGGSILSFCDWRMVPLLSPVMESAGYRLRNLIVWDKGSFGCGSGFRPRHEMIIHLTERSPDFHSMSVGNVIQSKRVRNGDHPTEKPVDLIETLIKVVVPSRGVVLDPFLGSGTTGVAAINLGMSFIGIERDRGYFETSIKRIKKAFSSRSSSLFAADEPKPNQLEFLK